MGVPKVSLVQRGGGGLVGRKDFEEGQAGSQILAGKAFEAVIWDQNHRAVETVKEESNKARTRMKKIIVTGDLKRVEKDGKGSTV